jgi:hypothetical protein
MTKENLIDLIYSDVTAGSDNYSLNKKFHKADIEKYVEIAMNTLIVQAYLNSERYKDFAQLDVFTKAFKNVSVHYDDNRGEYFSILPCSIVALGKNSGVRLISPMKSQNKPYQNIQNNRIQVYSNIESTKLFKDTCFYLEGDKIYYFNPDEYIENKVPVLMKLIVSFSSYDDFDEVVMPIGSEVNILEIVRNLMGIRQNKITDDKNDNSSNND